MQTTEEIIKKKFDELQTKHKFSCTLSEEATHNFMMEFAYDLNAIVYDVKKLEETYEQGVNLGVYKFNFEKFILFCLVHELGHYYDYQENKDAFKFTNLDEYIKIEENGIKKAMKLITQEDCVRFYFFNQHILQSYRSLINSTKT